jgi:hypothetical protein
MMSFIFRPSLAAKILTSRIKSWGNSNVVFITHNSIFLGLCQSRFVPLEECQPVLLHRAIASKQFRFVSFGFIARHWKPNLEVLIAPLADPDPQSAEILQDDAVFVRRHLPPAIRSEHKGALRDNEPIF